MTTGYDFLNGVFNLLHIVKCFGPRCVFIASIAVFAPIYVILPFKNLTCAMSVVAQA